MTIDIGKLKARFVETVTRDGDYGDGGGLYLQVRNGGRGKSWIFRYHVPGEKGDRYYSIGPAKTIRLVEARERARLCRQQRLDGIDPLEARAKAKVDRQLALARDKTLGEVYFEWLDAHGRTLFPNTLREYRRIMKNHVLPTIGDHSIQRFDMRNENSSAIELLGSVLKPLWLAGKIKTGELAQMQLRSTLDWANAHYYIRGDNAADLSGPLGIVLTAKNILANYTPKNHAALPYKEIGSFMETLRSLRQPGGERHLIGYALEFVILTAPRRQMVATARWDEIDWDDRRWDCSKHKTQRKTKRPYVIFLNEPAMAVLKKMKEMQAIRGVKSEYVFDLPGPGRHHAGHIFPPSIYRFLSQNMGRKDITVHGFRTTFSSWAYDAGYDPVAIEIALNHNVGNAMAQIYNRQAEKVRERRQLMDAWGAECNRTEPLPSSVTPIRQPRKELSA